MDTNDELIATGKAQYREFLLEAIECVQNSELLTYPDPQNSDITKATYTHNFMIALFNNRRSEMPNFSQVQRWIGDDAVRYEIVQEVINLTRVTRRDFERVLQPGEFQEGAHAEMRI